MPLLLPPTRTHLPETNARNKKKEKKEGTWKLCKRWRWRLTYIVASIDASLSLSSQVNLNVATASTATITITIRTLVHFSLIAAQHNTAQTILWLLFAAFFQAANWSIAKRAIELNRRDWITLVASSEDEEEELAGRKSKKLGKITRPPHTRLHSGERTWCRLEKVNIQIRLSRRLHPAGWLVKKACMHHIIIKAKTR